MLVPALLQVAWGENFSTKVKRAPRAKAPTLVNIYVFASTQHCDLLTSFPFLRFKLSLCSVVHSLTMAKWGRGRMRVFDSNLYNLGNCNTDPGETSSCQLEWISLSEPRLTIAAPFWRRFAANLLCERIQSQDLHEGDCVSAPNHIYTEFWRAVQWNCRHKCNDIVQCCLFCAERPWLSVELSFGVQPFVVLPWFMRETERAPDQMNEYKCSSGTPNSFSINFSLSLLTNLTVSSSWRRSFSAARSTLR